MRDGANWYVYCYGNPLRYIDRTGLKAGDFFSSPREAAIDFAMTYNDDSIRWGREFGSTLYSRNDRYEQTVYSYSEPWIGSDNGCDFSPAPEWTTAVAQMHTHGKYTPDYDNNNFSPGDRNSALDDDVDAYVATPNGSLLMYDHKTRLSSTISNNIWSDPNDPDRIDGTPDGNTGTPDSFGREPWSLLDWLGSFIAGILE